MQLAGLSSRIAKTHIVLAPLVGFSTSNQYTGLLKAHIVAAFLTSHLTCV